MITRKVSGDTAFMSILMTEGQYVSLKRRIDRGFFVEDRRVTICPSSVIPVHLALASEGYRPVTLVSILAIHVKNSKMQKPIVPVFATNK